MAAQYGQVTFVSLTRVPQTVTTQIYLDDTAGNSVKFDVGGGDAAKGAEEFRPTVPVLLRDICIAAAATPTKTAINRGGARIATILNAVHLASVTNRPVLSLGFGPNAPISMNQVA